MSIFKPTPEQARQNEKTYYVMVVGLFLAILDIQIVASSLGEIQSHLNASLDEISWVQTAYLMAEVVMIPIAAWLSELLSTRVLFSRSAMMFVLASGACAFSWNLESMVFFRILQGLFAGCMIPTVFSAIYMIFPPAKRTQATIIAGLVATLAPTLGPTLGGWITTSYSWEWLFWINVIPGFFVAFFVHRHLDIDRPHPELWKTFDYYGFSLMVLSLCGLELFLKQGKKYDWFESSYILLLFSVMVTSGALFIYRQLYTKNIILNLRVFKDINFFVGCVLSFATGVGLFGSLYLMPLFLKIVKDDNSFQIGTTMFVTGFFQFFSGPLAGSLEKYLSLPKILFLGLVFFGIGTFMNGFLTVDSAFSDFFWPQCVRGLSIMLCFLPMTTLTLGGLAPDEVKNASGLFNLMRNLGGAIGIAMIDSLLNNRVHIHQSILAENMSQQKWNRLSPDFSAFDGIMDPDHGPLLAEKMMFLKAHLQAFVMAFNDIFQYLGVYLFVCSALIILVKPIKS